MHYRAGEREGGEIKYCRSQRTPQLGGCLNCVLGSFANVPSTDDLRVMSNVQVRHAVQNAVIPISNSDFRAPYSGCSTDISPSSVKIPLSLRYNTFPQVKPWF